MNEDMSNIMNQINNMIKNNEIPDDIKNIISGMTNNSKNTSENQKHQDVSSDNSSINSSDNPSESSSMPEFDMATIMKMKNVMDMMKSNKDDPRANLLKSLKPYLKESRKEKVDQYIQLFGMGKVFEMLNPLGGDKNK